MMVINAVVNSSDTFILLPKSSIGDFTVLIGMVKLLKFIKYILDCVPVSIPSIIDSSLHDTNMTENDSNRYFMCLLK